MSDSTTDPKTRTAAIGEAYLRDRKRFRDSVTNILLQRNSIPSLDAGEEYALGCGKTPPPIFIQDSWRFTFAGVPFKLEFVPMTVSNLEQSVISFAQVSSDSEASAVGCGHISIDTEGRTGNILEGFTLPGDAVAMFRTLLANRFANLKVC